MISSLHPVRRLWNAAYLLLTATAFFWAANSVVARGARFDVPPMALAFWRWSIALALLLPLAWPHLKRDRDIIRSNMPRLLLLGVLGIGAFNTLLYNGLQYTTAINSLLIQGAQPALIVMAGFLMFRDSSSIRQLAGMVLSSAGVVTIIARGRLSVLLGLDFGVGDLLVALATILWAIYSVSLRTRPSLHPLSFLAVSFAIGVAFLAPLYALEIASGHFIQPKPGSVLAIGFVAIFPSLIAYLLFNRAIDIVGAAKAGIFLNVMPLFGSLMAVAFLGERLEAFHFGGIVLIAAGIFLAVRQPRIQKRSPESR